MPGLCRRRNSSLHRSPPGSADELLDPEELQDQSISAWDAHGQATICSLDGAEIFYSVFGNSLDAPFFAAGCGGGEFELEWLVFDVGIREHYGVGTVDGFPQGGMHGWKGPIL